jgi:hypothetical protein
LGTAPSAGRLDTQNHAFNTAPDFLGAESRNRERFAIFLHGLLMMIGIMPILAFGIFTPIKPCQHEKHQHKRFHRTLLIRLAVKYKIANSGINHQVRARRPQAKP